MSIIFCQWSIILSVFDLRFRDSLFLIGWVSLPLYTLLKWRFWAFRKRSCQYIYVDFPNNSIGYRSFVHSAFAKMYIILSYAPSITHNISEWWLMLFKAHAYINKYLPWISPGECRLKCMMFSVLSIVSK